MKKAYFIILLLLCQNTFSQDFLGEWFLHYIEVGGTIQNSTIPNSFNNIVFESDNEYHGSVCSNGYNGTFTLNDDNSFSNLITTALTGFCNYSEENGYLNSYLDGVLGFTGEREYSYEINGIGSDATLKLIRTDGNYALYGRLPLPENHLPGIWYLHYISENGIIQNNTFNPSFFIDFTLAPDLPTFGDIIMDGYSICNNYFGNYYLIDQFSLYFMGISGGLEPNSCSNTMEDNYESTYNSIVGLTGDGVWHELDYESVGEGLNATLMLTNSEGDFAFYGRETLSINEFDFVKIELTENPVDTSIKLSGIDNNQNDFSYTIVSIEGKVVIKNRPIKGTEINVDFLNSNIYFLKISSGIYQKTIKFIKK